MKSLKVATSKRILIQRIRRISEKEINNAMNPRIDLELLFPESIRRIFRRSRVAEL